MGQIQSFPFIDQSLPRIRIGINPNTFGASAFISIPLVEEFAGRAFPISLVFQREYDASGPGLDGVGVVSFSYFLTKNQDYTIDLFRPGRPLSRFFPVVSGTNPSAIDFYVDASTGERIYRTGTDQEPRLTLNAADGSKYRFGFQGGLVERIDLPDGMALRVYFRNSPRGANLLALYTGEPTSSHYFGAEFQLSSADAILSGDVFVHSSNADTSYAYVALSKQQTYLSVSRTLYSPAATADSFRLYGLSGTITMALAYASGLLAYEEAQFTRSQSQMTVYRKSGGVSGTRVTKLTKVNERLAKFVDEDGRETLFSSNAEGSLSLFPELSCSIGPVGEAAGMRYDEWGCLTEASDRVCLASASASRRSLLADPCFEGAVWNSYGTVSAYSGDPTGAAFSLAGTKWKQFAGSIGGVYQSADVDIQPDEPLLFLAVVYVPTTASSLLATLSLTGSGPDGSEALSSSFGAAELPAGALRLLTLPVRFGRSVSHVSAVVRIEGASAYLKQAQLLRGATCTRFHNGGRDFPSGASKGGAAFFSHVLGEGRDPNERRSDYSYGAAPSPLRRFHLGTSLADLEADDLGASEATTYSPVSYAEGEGSGYNCLPVSVSRAFPDASPLAASLSYDVVHWRLTSRASEGIQSSYSADLLGRMTSVACPPVPARSAAYDGCGRPTSLSVGAYSASVQHGYHGVIAMGDGAFSYSFSYESSKGNPSSASVQGAAFLAIESQDRFDALPTKASRGACRYTYINEPCGEWSYRGLVCNESLVQYWDRTLLPDGEEVECVVGPAPLITKVASYDPATGVTSMADGAGFSRTFRGGSSTIKTTWWGQSALADAPCGGAPYQGDRKTFAKALSDGGWLTSRLFLPTDGFALSREGPTESDDVSLEPSLTPSVGRTGGILCARFPGEAAYSVPADPLGRLLSVGMAFYWDGGASTALRIVRGGVEALRLSVDSQGNASLTSSGSIAHPLTAIGQGWNGISLGFEGSYAVVGLNGVVTRSSLPIAFDTSTDFSLCVLSNPYDAVACLAVGFSGSDEGRARSLSLACLDQATQTSFRLGGSGHDCLSYSAKAASVAESGNTCSFAFAPLEGGFASTDGTLPCRRSLPSAVDGPSAPFLSASGAVKAREFAFRPEFGRMAWRAFGESLAYRFASTSLSLRVGFSLAKGSAGRRYVLSMTLGGLTVAAFSQGGALFVEEGGTAYSTGFPLAEGQAHWLSCSLRATGEAAYALDVWLGDSLVRSSSGSATLGSASIVLSLGTDAQFSRPLQGHISSLSHCAGGPTSGLPALASSGRVLRCAVASDAYGRKRAKTIEAEGFSHRTDYQYRLLPSGGTSMLSRETIARGGSSRAIDYSYDAAGRLVSEGGNQIAYDARGYVSAHGGTSFVYDVYGNISQMSCASWTRTFSYTLSGSGKGRLLEASSTTGRKRTFSYPSGNPLYPSSVADARPPSATITTTLTYYMSHLTSAKKGSTTYRYRYDDRGRLISRAPTSGSTHYYAYSGSRLVADLVPGTRDLLYEYGPDGLPCALYSRAPWRENRYAIETDALGRVIALVGINCYGAAEYSYDAWGAPTLSSDTTSEGIGSINRLLFKGYLYLDELEAYSLGLRHYDPFSCRFWEPDDLGFLDPSLAAGLNPYAYCNNDPISYQDPTGRSPFLVSLLFAMGIGGALSFGISLAQQLNEANGNWRSINWGLVCGNFLLGAAFGAASIFGGAAGLAFTGVAIGGYSMTAGVSLGLAVGVSSLASMACYSLGTIKTNNWSLQAMIQSGILGAIQGAATFAMGFLGGKNGLFLESFKTHILPGELVHISGATMPYIYGIARACLIEDISRFALVSVPSAGLRFILDWFIPEEEC